MILEVTNKEDFIADLKKARRLKLGIAVMVKLPEMKIPEMIANPYQNISAKINYYNNAYDDEMRLKKNPKVHITHLMIDAEGNEK